MRHQQAPTRTAPLEPGAWPTPAPADAVRSWTSLVAGVCSLASLPLGFVLGWALTTPGSPTYDAMRSLGPSAVLVGLPLITVACAVGLGVVAVRRSSKPGELALGIMATVFAIASAITTAVSAILVVLIFSGMGSSL